VSAPFLARKKMFRNFSKSYLHGGKSTESIFSKKKKSLHCRARILTEIVSFFTFGKKMQLPFASLVQTLNPIRLKGSYSRLKDQALISKSGQQKKGE
jgi:hypothetical protein